MSNHDHHRDLEPVRKHPQLEQYHNTMKNSSKAILLTAGIGAGLGLASCVAPYGEPTTTTSFGTYRPGYTVRALPSGYRTENISGDPYYYHNGAYYQRQNGRYVVVKAPRSSRYYDEYTRHGNRTVHNHPDGSSHVIDELPRGYTTVDYKGEPYYRHQDRYYRRQGSGFVIARSPF